MFGQQRCDGPGFVDLDPFLPPVQGLLLTALEANQKAIESCSLHETKEISVPVQVVDPTLGPDIHIQPARENALTEGDHSLSAGRPGIIGKVNGPSPHLANAVLHLIKNSLYRPGTPPFLPKLGGVTIGALERASATPLQHHIVTPRIRAHSIADWIGEIECRHGELRQVRHQLPLFRVHQRPVRVGLTLLIKRRFRASGQPAQTGHRRQGRAPVVLGGR